ncbi:hypothetical protein CONLIGDRAFT_648141 [Coniochaeta ligniaria NRRL 30616]|uniref:Uncharacterized protein n=1 Tax=Coniochaeta ligniaria NRRL 30616 TaxID=1408157 RepID=A0A1J7J5K0_9PEZI|nr:hypothetical protein CONLIGDRAFT_648141 [Coniochaeta ligniaria NRRL 30616]
MLLVWWDIGEMVFDSVSRLSRPFSLTGAFRVCTDRLAAAKATRAAVTEEDRHITTVLRDMYRQRSKAGEKAKAGTVTLKQEIALSVTTFLEDIRISNTHFFLPYSRYHRLKAQHMCHHGTRRFESLERYVPGGTEVQRLQTWSWSHITSYFLGLSPDVPTSFPSWLQQQRGSFKNEMFPVGTRRISLGSQAIFGNIAPQQEHKKQQKRQIHREQNHSCASPYNYRTSCCPSGSSYSGSACLVAVEVAGHSEVMFVEQLYDST